MSSTTLAIIAPRPTKRDLIQKVSKCQNTQLTKKEKLAIEFYLRGNNPAKAAELAGYSPFTAESAATEIFKRPHIVREIKRRRDEDFLLEEVSTNDILGSLQKTAFANPLDYIEVTDTGWIPNLKKISRDMGIAIQELSYDAQGRPKIKWKDGLKAIELLAKIKKMFADIPEGAREEKTLTIKDLDDLVREPQNVTINQQFIYHNSKNRLPEAPATSQIVDATP